MRFGFLSHAYDITAVLLFGIGFATLFLNRNLVKKIIGLNIAESAVYLFLASKGYVAGGAAPIVAGIGGGGAYVNPLPASLIVTGIVISACVTAFSLAIVISIYKHYEVLDLDEILAMAARESKTPD